jgi:hypothetical protein
MWSTNQSALRTMRIVRYFRLSARCYRGVPCPGMLRRRRVGVPQFITSTKLRVLFKHTYLPHTIQ